MSKVKVELKQAIDFAAAGLEIECYVITPKAAVSVARQHHPVVPKHAIVTLSLDGREPSKGKLRVVWLKVKKEMWEKDMTAQYTREHVDKCIIKHGGDTAHWMFSNMLNKLHIMRRVDV